MTMFYSRSDLRFLEEKRIREIVNEEIDRREAHEAAEMVRFMTSVGDVMEGPTSA